MVKEKWPKSRLDVLLMPLVGDSELVSLWWMGPNKAFNDWTPWALYQSDDWPVVVNYILGQYRV